jgi:acyl dehydratase
MTDAVTKDGADLEVDWESAKITDEGLAEMRAAIGKRPIKLEGWNTTVSRDNIRHFAWGIGDDNPLWTDSAYGALSPYGEIIAPPCYLYSHMTGPRLDPEKSGRTSIEEFLPGVLGLMANERWVWHRPAFLDETIFAETCLNSVVLHERGKLGGRSVTQIDRAVLTTESGDLVAENFTTIKRFERAQVRSNQLYVNRPLGRYSQEDRDRFARQYESESNSRRGDRPRYVEDVALGDLVGSLLKGPFTLSITIAFLAGIGCAFTLGSRLHHAQLKGYPAALMVHPDTGVAENMGAPHWDAVFAKLGGMPAGYDFGVQRISWFTHLLTDWAGDHAMIAEVDMRLREPMFLGDIGWFNGRIIAKEGNQVTVAMEATNQLGGVFSVATARVILPRKGDLTSHLKIPKSIKPS